MDPKCFVSKQKCIEYIEKLPFMVTFLCLFVSVEVLRPSQPNRAMSSVVSLPNHTFTG